jgi:NitT/TauT family transport system permease protein
MITQERGPGQSSSLAATPAQQRLPAMILSEKSRRRRHWLIPLLRLGVVAATLLLWQFASGRLIPGYLISDPVSVALRTIATLSTAAGWRDVWTTFQEVVIGFALGTLLGATTGLFFGTFQTAGLVFEPLIAAVNGIPKIALAPLFLIFFGLGIWSKVAIAMMSVAFVMFYNIYLGRHAISKDLSDIVRVMGGKRRHLLKYVTGPALIPPFLAGLKAGGPLAMLGVIAGEFIASYDGIGHALAQAAASFDAAGAFSGLVILVALALLINAALGTIERALMRRLEGIR